jgi:hypothetical protein
MLFRTRAQRDKEEIEFLRAQVAQLQNYVLMTGGGAPIGMPTWSTPNPVPTPEGGEGPDLGPIEVYRNEAQRLYTTEEEEDIHFALEEGLIDQAEANRRLKEVAETANDIELM